MNDWDLFIKNVSKLKRKNNPVIFRKRFLVEEMKRFDGDLFLLTDKGPFNVEHFSKRQKRNFQGKRTLDLHGMTVDGAMTAVEEFLKTNFLEGIREVIIITGGSERLNKAIRSNFLVMVHRDFSYLVSMVSTAMRDKGGTGAFYVKLRKNPKK